MKRLKQKLLVSIRGKKWEILVHNNRQIKLGQTINIKYRHPYYLRAGNFFTVCNRHRSSVEFVLGVSGLMKVRNDDYLRR